MWLSGRDGTSGTLSANTFGQRLRMLRVFFERIIEWDWPGAPPRNPVIGGDIPPRPDPLPRFLDDRDAARLMAAARVRADPRDRLVTELPARTGMRAGEPADLEGDAVVLTGAAHWLRIPSASSATTATCPCTPSWSHCSPPGPPSTWPASAPAAAWPPATAAPCTATRPAVSPAAPAAAAASSVHPRQLRHTLATQAINRGMRLEAIAALPGHYAGDLVKLIMLGDCLAEAG